VTLETGLALVMFAALDAYAVLAGADFGAGIWDLLASGTRRAAHREALAHAIGPVWEANHVWLIFLVVLLFTCFPAAYAQASVALFWPLHAVLIGIVLRGAAFVFRAYATTSEATRNAWGSVFGASSALTPILLGMCLGALSTGDAYRWYDPFPIATGVLALLICAYLAAVYLAWESHDGDLRDDFRRRALATWWIAGAASIAVLLLARSEAARLWTGLTSTPGVLFIAGGSLLAPASFAALRSRRFNLARFLCVAQIVALLAGWAAAQWPFLIYPDVTVSNAAAPASTLHLIAWTLPFGLAALLPALWFLFRVFKSGGVHGSDTDTNPASAAPTSARPTTIASAIGSVNASATKPSSGGPDRKPR
jgi:cytochrome d ubiquinol oxidase subunit II